ncbi:molybdopterin biosynthesis protein MoeA [Parvularcula bermudensis HTCC2503]|uniref:Molybdopterin molybdenumtransferase n=1 Tax=Parvularcula bermudensis (strain ATCC BAA-594 / HTCC2503 / KCTC 12087) TaxID=314260 RepID=E0THG7_PARBH|nr:molybdopterin molybdotransferase MoeA [Parvularcula bermudensis]ADM10759.1 molybdopterin biosynthesis protein MoeA [Parvularcula bermudensis HTCC2503]
MISVDDALRQIGSSLKPLPSVTVPVGEAAGRILAEAVRAKVTQPPTAVSAMDGYAVNMVAPMTAGTQIRVLGEAPAGRPYVGTLTGGAVRVFTGSAMPTGANHVIIQEHVERHGDTATLTHDQRAARNVRPAGGDFAEGDVLAPALRWLSPIDLSLLSAAGVVETSVYRRPRIALFANGDELVPPGKDLARGQVYESLSTGLLPLLDSWGAEACFLGIAADRESAVEAMFEAASDADIVVPIGGASVGDYDVAKAVGRKRFDLYVEKVAVKPGKPVWFGTKAEQAVLGFPGNPASAFVCAHLFLRPALQALSGGEPRLDLRTAILDAPLPPNGPREHFMRASVAEEAEGRLVCQPAARQDSSLLSTFAASNALLRRGPNEEARAAGDPVAVLLF